MAKLTVDGFENFWRYYKGASGNQPQQSDAIRMLYEAMPQSLLDEGCVWIQRYRETPPQPESTGGIPQAAVDLIKEFEGFRSCPYNDGVGIATIGYGATFYQDGRAVAFGDPCLSEAEGEDLLKYHLQYFWGIQEVSIPYWKEMSDGQRGCLLSFSFNIGAHFYGSSGCNTITGALRDKRWGDVPDALRLYVNPGTAVEAGLRRRREAEIELWLS
jgi:GH24 family phage-related lysozyme (muramidase)|tara:strand:+ start:121 stop:765 length:645 start_codon:yes stop_codon:yes gene_type:complete